MRKFFVAILIVVFLILTSCATLPRPDHVEDICSIFTQYPDWYRDAKQCQARWGVPIAVQMSIINQESSFGARAAPPRKKLLWIIPWKRPTSAYGYSQALKNTWKDYQRQTGNSYGKRQEFADATDFIGWYSHQAHLQAGVAANNPYALYLAYHEGINGYSKYSYIKKPWLIRVARKVSTRTLRYQNQLIRCERYLVQS